MASEERTLLLLKRVVYSLGILLVCGVIALFGLIMYRMSTPKPVPVTHTKVQKATPSATCAVPISSLDIKGEIVETELENGRLHLLTRQENGSYELLVVDSCTGKIMGQMGISSVVP